MKLNSIPINLKSIIPNIYIDSILGIIKCLKIKMLKECPSML